MPYSPDADASRPYREVLEVPGGPPPGVWEVAMQSVELAMAEDLAEGSEHAEAGARETPEVLEDDAADTIVAEPDHALDELVNLPDEGPGPWIGDGDGHA